MAFIGNTSTTQSFAPAIDYFNGNGSTVAFTLSRPVASVAQVQVVVNNVAQNPSSAYTVSGNTITFTSAPSSGTSNIYVYYTSPITQVVQPSVGTISGLQLDIANLNGTGALQLPTGTTAQRPTGATGLIRQNSTTGNPEWYDSISAQWLNFSQNTGYNVNYLVVAGGGGGSEAGGGAGGLLESITLLTIGTSYSVTVGAGGAGSSAVTTTSGTSGSSSSLGTIAISIGGGGGGHASSVGSNGGSGGGGGYGASYVGGSGTAGQGFAGGAGSNAASRAQAGGGGGASAIGGTATGTAAGNGGAGITSTISGSSVAYGGGGGGSGDARGTANGSGGVGGGGAGGSSTNGFAGTANTGGGGGGGGFNGGAWLNGAAGGSGIVILSYLGAQRGTGGTVTSSGGYTIHTFTTSGTFTA
jgi:hypothetical protein